MQTITLMKTLCNSSKVAKLIFTKSLNAFNESLNHSTKNWRKITSLLVVGSLLFGTIVPPMSFAADFSQKKSGLNPRDQIKSVPLYYAEEGEGKEREKERGMEREEEKKINSYLRVMNLKEPVSFQKREIKSNIYKTDENHRLRKESGFREGGKLASESKVLALAAPYIPIDQFSRVSQTFSKQVKAQIRRDALASDQSSIKSIPATDKANSFVERAGQNGSNGMVKGIAQQSKDFPSISQSIANQVSYFVSRVSALHAGDIEGMLIRNREKHSLNISEDEFMSEKFYINPFNQFLANYLEIYFEQYRVKVFEEMTDEDIKEGRKPLTQEESETIKEIELVFEEEANKAFRYVGLTRVKVGIWEGPGMVESEDVWMLAPLFITDTSEEYEKPWDTTRTYHRWVRNETGRAFINRGIIKKWLEIKEMYGKEAMLDSIKVYVVRELGAQAIMDMQREIGAGGANFDVAHTMVEVGDSIILKNLMTYSEKMLGLATLSIYDAHKWNPEKLEKYVSLALAVIEGWSLDHKGLMELGRRVANDIRLGDFVDYVYVRDLVDSMFETDIPAPINPLGLMGEFLGEMYENVREGKNGVGDYANALNDIFSLIRRNKEFYLQYKKLVERALNLLKKKGKNWKEIGLHKIIPMPGDEESLKPLMELIRELEKGNDNSQGIVKVVGTILLVLSSVLIGQEVLANGLVPMISSGISFIDALPIITGGSGFLLLGHQLGKESQNKSNQLYKGQENQNYPSSDIVDPYIARTAQFLGDTELVKALFSFYQSVMDSIEEPGVRFLANIKDLMENPSKLNELKNFAEESARNASVIGNSPFNLSQDGQDNSRETAKPYELVIVTDENKLLSKEEIINFLKRYQVPTEYVRVIHHPFKDEMFDLKSLVEKPENKLIEDGYSLRVINNKYWLIIKELLKNSFIINGLELLELNLIGKKSVDSAA